MTWAGHAVGRWTQIIVKQVETLLFTD